VKNITPSADQDSIEQARQVARALHKTLHAAFREWLLHFTAQSGNDLGKNNGVGLDRPV
jgi:hypothetical protein